MLSIFSIPKAFDGHDGVIQRNAIESWKRIQPTCEIILCADDSGVAEAAVEFGVKHLPNIARTEYGTPLLDSAFDQVKQIAVNDLLCFVNADIILLNEILEAVKRVQFREFLMLGQRWDLDITQPLEFDRPDWEMELRRYVADNGVLHPPTGIDYFVFPRDGELSNLPPLAVGRRGWDHWFIYQARKLHYRVVDATKVVTVIHQNHDYSHVPNRTGNKSSGPESDRNMDLIGQHAKRFTILDSTHIMTSNALLPAFGFMHLRKLHRSFGKMIATAKSLLRSL